MVLAFLTACVYCRSQITRLVALATRTSWKLPRTIAKYAPNAYLRSMKVCWSANRTGALATGLHSPMAIESPGLYIDVDKLLKKSGSISADMDLQPYHYFVARDMASERRPTYCWFEGMSSHRLSNAIMALLRISRIFTEIHFFPVWTMNSITKRVVPR